MKNIGIVLPSTIAGTSVSLTVPRRMRRPADWRAGECDRCLCVTRLGAVAGTVRLQQCYGSLTPALQKAA